MATPAGYKHSPRKLKPYRQGRHCPVTAGHPSRMTEATFSRLCAAKQAAANDAICIECNGAMPPELEILEQLIMEDAMTTRNSWEGVCYLCGEKKTVRSMKDEKQCCGTCEHIYRNAVNNPGLLVEALKKGQGDEYLRQEVWPSPRPADQVTESDRVLNHIWANNNLEPGADIEAFVDNLVAESEWLKNRLDATKHIIATIRDQLDLDEGQPILEAVALLQRERQQAMDSMYEIRGLMGIDQDESIIDAISGLRREWQHAVKLCTETLAMLGADAGTNLNNLPQLAAELFASNDRRRHHIADLEAIVDGDQIQPTIGEIVHDTRTSTLLDLAIDVIAGRVSGIDAERIAALR